MLGLYHLKNCSLPQGDEPFSPIFTFANFTTSSFVPRSKNYRTFMCKFSYELKCLPCLWSYRKEVQTWGWHCGVTGKAVDCNADIPFGDQFVSEMLHFKTIACKYSEEGAEEAEDGPSGWPGEWCLHPTWELQMKLFGSWLWSSWDLAIVAI